MKKEEAMRTQTYKSKKKCWHKNKETNKNSQTHQMHHEEQSRLEWAHMHNEKR